MEQPTPTIQAPTIPSITPLAYFHELCSKKSGPILSHLFKPRVQIPSPVRKNDIYWKGQLIVTTKEHGEMTFEAQASTKKQVQQELAKVFLSKAGLTIPTISLKSQKKELAKRQDRYRYNMFQSTCPSIPPDQIKAMESWLRKHVPLTSSKPPSPEDNERLCNYLNTDFLKTEKEGEVWERELQVPGIGNRDLEVVSWRLENAYLNSKSTSRESLKRICPELPNGSGDREMNGIAQKKSDEKEEEEDDPNRRFFMDIMSRNHSVDTKSGSKAVGDMDGISLSEKRGEKERELRKKMVGALERGVEWKVLEKAESTEVTSIEKEEEDSGVAFTDASHSVM